MRENNNTPLGSNVVQSENTTVERILRAVGAVSLPFYSGTGFLPGMWDYRIRSDDRRSSAQSTDEAQQDGYDDAESRHPLGKRGRSEQQNATPSATASECHGGVDQCRGYSEFRERIRCC
jgi:hypothetical protein